MSELERKLTEEKKRLEETKAPAELTDRLRKVLDQTPARKKNRLPQWVAAVAVLLMLSFAGYQYNALAYYGKMLFGFEEIMPQRLAQLNEEGYGQSVNQRVLLTDGSELTIDGVLADENQFVLYYTVSNPAGVEDDMMFFQLNGFWTNSSPRSGTTSMNEKETMLKGIQTFDPVSAFAKELTLELQGVETQNQQNITFAFDAHAAMQTQLKQKVKQKVAVDEGVIRFDSIIATPSQTTVKGKLKVDHFDRIPLAFSGVHLIVDGIPMEMTGSGTSSGFTGSVFTIDYDALPKEFDTLEIEVDTFIGHQEVDETIELTAKETTATIGGEKVVIRDAEVTEDGLELTVLTKENVLLDGVSAHGRLAMPLLTTVRHEYVVDPQEKIEYKKRTLLFDGDQLPAELSIKGLYYGKRYGKIIDIPVKK